MPGMKARHRRQFAANAAAEAAPRPAQRITVNTSEYELRRAREGLISGMYGSLDAKRPRAWEQYGYPEEVTFDALLKAYERGGAAHGAVHRILDKCWREAPRVKQPEADEETPWETKLGKVFKAAGVWRKLRDLDRRNMVGRYAAVIYRVADGQPLSAPLVRAQKLVDVVPLYESQIQVTAWDSDTASPTFGKPLMFQYRARRPGSGDTQGQPDQWADVHPSRVQILAEGSVGDFFDGVPLLKAGFNSLIDLEKVSGGSAESFLKNSSRTLVLSMEAGSSLQQLAATPGTTAPTGADIKTAIEEKTQALNRNIDGSIVLQGGEASTLQTTVADPGPAFEVAANMFAASVQIPYTVLFGQQTGRLASDQDIADMNERCAGRQTQELTPMIEEFVTRMQAAGIIDEGEFEVEWPELDAMTEGEQLDNAAKMASINKANMDAGQPAAFDGNEIRRVAGFEERDELKDIPLEGDPGPTPEEIAAAAAKGAAGLPSAPRAPVALKAAA